MSNKKIETMTNTFTKYFEKKDAARETALKLSREISRSSTNIIRKLHSTKSEDVSQLITDLNGVKNQFKELKSVLKPHPELYYSKMVSNYTQEYVEATIMLTLIKNDLKVSTIPSPDKLGTDFITYLLGLSDVIGEFRRCTLDAICAEDLRSATAYLAAMEQLFEIIITLNYPDGVLPLRHKQDVARALIEKTRGELAFAVSEHSLKENITGLKKELKHYNKKIVRKN